MRDTGGGGGGGPACLRAGSVPGAGGGGGSFTMFACTIKCSGRDVRREDAIGIRLFLEIDLSNLSKQLRDHTNIKQLNVIKRNKWDSVATQSKSNEGTIGCKSSAGDKVKLILFGSQTNTTR